MPNLEEFTNDPLSDAELKKVRRMLVADDRARWFWAASRTLALYVTGVIVAITTSYSWLKDIVKALSQ